MLAFFTEEEGAVGGVVHEEVFGEDGGAAGVAEEVEGGLDVGIAVGEVHPETLVGDVELGGVIEAGGEAVGRGVLGRGVGAPAGGVVPAVAFAGSVAVDGNEDDVLFAEGVAEAVDAVAALEEANVFFFRDQEFGVVAPGLESGDDAAGKKPVLGVFQETAVGTPLSLGVDAVVEKNLHSCRLGSDGKLKIICGNNYIQVFPLSLHWIHQTRSIHKRNVPGVHFECASGLLRWFSQNVGTFW